VSKGKRLILRNVNLEIRCGELTAIIGPNGAGKSTLLRAILGEVPHRGKISFVHGEGDLSRRPRIGYVPQKLELDAGSPTSVRDLILATRSNAPVWLAKTGQGRLHAESVLSRVQAAHVLDRRLGSLSGGELQRVLLALALDPLPQLLLLDEPAAGVDLKGMALFYDLVAELRRSYDLSIVLVSHDLALVAQHADRIVFLNQTVLRAGTPREVLADQGVVEAFGEGVVRHLGLV
jgi:zinc transport system ATP-binding protein